MGGGPRTFSGGVNKWKWKRMQAKKAEQLLKARLAWERQIYEMRKRAELKVQVLADRFQKPGGLDLWSEKDGPELFKTVDRFPSPRFFLKGVVHSIRPYGRVNEEIDEFGGLGNEKRVFMINSRKLCLMLLLYIYSLKWSTSILGWIYLERFCVVISTSHLIHDPRPLMCEG
ncbi:hypothetical protein ACET3Z_018286 [Daucus carota]